VKLAALTHLPFNPLGPGLKVRCTQQKSGIWMDAITFHVVGNVTIQLHAV